VTVAVDGLFIVMDAGENDFTADMAPFIVSVFDTLVGLEMFWSLVRVPAGMVLVRTPDPSAIGVVTVKMIVQVLGNGPLTYFGRVPPE
jgi:hypothetical protein